MWTTALSIILAVFKSIPVLKEWFDKLVVLYVNYQIDNMKEDDRKAIRKAIDEQDQRDLETQIGNPNAGERSNLPGTELRDSLPGVLQSTKPSGDSSSHLLK